MFKRNPLVLHGLLWLVVADSAPFPVFRSIAHVQMTEETDVHGDLHMLALDDVGMTAPAVKVYAPSLLSKMGLVVEDNLPAGKIHFRFYQPLLMAPRLEAL